MTSGKGVLVVTRRWFADSSVSYALAAIRLIEYARAHKEQHFEFGPMDAEAMRESGLTVSGPDLDGIAELLDGIPGLVEQNINGGEAPVPIT